jgi:hypothetical protein
VFARVSWSIAAAVEVNKYSVAANAVGRTVKVDIEANAEDSLSDFGVNSGTRAGV